MKKSFPKTALLAIVSILSLGALTFSPVLATSTICDQCGEGGTVPADICAANGCPNSDSINTFESSLTNILNGVIGAMGIVAVIFIIIGGINYMTSAGDTSKLEKAKKTILYALIGLIVCALSFAIVNLVVINILKN
jgi:amino acid transporter